MHTHHNVCAPHTMTEIARGGPANGRRDVILEQQRCGRPPLLCRRALAATSIALMQALAGCGGE